MNMKLKENIQKEMRNNFVDVDEVELNAYKPRVNEMSTEDEDDDAPTVVCILVTTSRVVAAIFSYLRDMCFTGRIFNFLYFFKLKKLGCKLFEENKNVLQISISWRRPKHEGRAASVG